MKVGRLSRAFKVIVRVYVRGDKGLNWVEIVGL